MEVVYPVCSLPMEQAQPEQVAAWVRALGNREPAPLGP